jgi:hypothetical protein
MLPEIFADPLSQPAGTTIVHTLAESMWWEFNAKAQSSQDAKPKQKNPNRVAGNLPTPGQEAKQRTYSCLIPLRLGALAVLSANIVVSCEDFPGARAVPARSASHGERRTNVRTTTRWFTRCDRGPVALLWLRLCRAVSSHLCPFALKVCCLVPA